MVSDAEKLLRARYSEKLPDKITAMQTLLEGRDVQQLQIHLHKLAGSAGMYGYDAISIVASDLEAVLVSENSVDGENFQALFAKLCAKVNAS
ncbi:MAG: Hpt domain-containing protein [Arenicella sp.]